MHTTRHCGCGHTTSQHELRTSLLGCFIVGCHCIDFTDADALTPFDPFTANEQVTR